MKKLGHLIIWRIADLAAPYDKLNILAHQTGFPTHYLPDPPSAYHAWQRATRLRKQRLIAPADLVEEVRSRFDCEPTVQAETRPVNSTTRHIIRSVTIGKARSKQAQLDVIPVAVLRYDEAGLTDEERFAYDYPHDDPLAAVNGNVDCLIHRMRLDYKRQLSTAAGQDIRAGVRCFLIDLEAVLLVDGTYFLPDTPEIARKLEALQAFIGGLSGWKLTGSSLTCQVYPVVYDGSPASERNRLEIIRAIDDQFGQELRGLLSDAGAPDGRGTEATKGKVARIEARLGEVEAAVSGYAAALAEGFGELREVIERCWQTINNAKGKLER